MKRACAVLLLVAITANCASRGPSTARTSSSVAEAPAPQANAVPGVWRQYAEKLAVGSILRVRTTSGERLTGTLLVVGAESITVSPRTRVPEPTREIRFDTIQQMDIVTGQGASLVRAIAIGAGVGAGVFFGLLLMAVAAWGD